jgi:hypothetical protein
MSFNPVTINNLASVGQSGNSVCVSPNGQWLIVGSPTANNGYGQADLYKLNLSGNWSLYSTYDGTNIFTGIQGNFGAAVTITDQILAIGMPKGQSTGAGAIVYIIYDEINEWFNSDIILCPYSGPCDFGSALSASGNWLAVGAPGTIGNTGFNDGTVFIYSINTTLNTYSIKDAVLDTVYATSKFGTSVSLSTDGLGNFGYTLLVGAPDANFTRGKAVYYTWNGSSYDISFTKTGLNINDKLGSSVSLSQNGGVIAIGAPGYNSNNGRVTVFDFNNTQIGPALNGTNSFGSTVALGDAVGIIYLGIKFGSSVTVQKTEDGISWTSHGQLMSGTSDFGKSMSFFTGVDISLAIGDPGTNSNLGTVLLVQYETKPSPPQNVSAAEGDSSATVSFSPPFGNGGAPITEYLVMAYFDNGVDTGISQSGLSSPIVISGLSNGVEYKFKVRCTNGVAVSDDSDFTNNVIPFATTLPDPPTITNVVAGDASATVSFSPPLNDGGSPIIDYTVTAYLANGSSTNITQTDVASPIIISGLTNGVEYKFTVYATNAVGDSVESDFSDVVTPAAPPTVPDPPTITGVSAGDASATVSFTPPLNDGGSAIQDYTVYVYLADGTDTGASVTDITSPILVTGLTNGTAYKFTMIATNGVGSSNETAFSSIVTPTGGGGGGGDPYITTIHGFNYKLPIIDAPIRYYQGIVGGKTLTINAQLRTMENEDLMAENIRCFYGLKSKMPAYKLREIESSLFRPVKLAFFEKFYIHYDGTEFVVNVWDHKFKIESYTGSRFISGIVDGKSLLKKYTNVYDNYDSQTISLTIGGVAKVYISIYPAKLLKNGVFIEAPDMAEGNGVLVNTLSTKDMTIPSLTHLGCVPKKDTRPSVKEEWFVDDDGYRTKKIYRAA